MKALAMTILVLQAICSTGLASPKSDFNRAENEFIGTRWQSGPPTVEKILEAIQEFGYDSKDMKVEEGNAPVSLMIKGIFVSANYHSYFASNKATACRVGVAEQKRYGPPTPLAFLVTCYPASSGR